MSKAVDNTELQAITQAHAKHGALLSQLTKIMDMAGIERIEPVHRRVEVMALMLEEARIREKRMQLQLAARSRGVADE